MKIVDERETQKTTTAIIKQNKNKQRQKRERGNKIYSERVRAKWFCCAFKLGLLQLICNASLVFKTNLELALSIILKKENCTTQSMLQWSVDV